MKTRMIYSVFFAAMMFISPLWAERSDLKIDKVFFAQHHVLEPDNPLFALTGDLPALIKVHVYSEIPEPSPFVFARLSHDGRSLTLPLRGPEAVPSRPTGDPILMEHSYDDSYSAFIPREWIRTGLKVVVELRDYDYSNVDEDDKIYEPIEDKDEITILDYKVFDPVKVGAPNRVVMQMFDIHYFGQGKGANYPQGWEAELAAKLPVSALEIHRVKNIMFDEIVMPPQFDGPSARYTSIEDYKKKTGRPFDGEQAVALRWCGALKTAGGMHRYWRPYHVNIAGVYSGGQAGGYRSCANLHRHGVLIHELGHTFGLPHWNGSRAYPYKRTMYGQDTGEPTTANAGPTWAFDVGRQVFLSPSYMEDGQLIWRKDPMQGGGRSNMKDFLYKHFSDYSIHQMRKRMENHAVYWNESIGNYAQWNAETGLYDRIVENNGVLFPVERDVDVISILVSANAAVPDANIIYPPIGPYKAGLILRFNAESPEDRKSAMDLGYAGRNCNVVLRVTQGENTTSYLTRMSVSPDDDPTRAFMAFAINLPARDGDVTEVEMLYCPELMEHGITYKHQTLYSWKAGE